MELFSRGFPSTEIAPLLCLHSQTGAISTSPQGEVRRMHALRPPSPLGEVKMPKAFWVRGNLGEGRTLS